MTTNEAINLLDEVKTIDDSMFQYSTAYMKALDMAIYALKKQIPKKPYKDHDSDLEYIGRLKCPNCQTILGHFNDRTGYVGKQINLFYCSGCGQKLDWSKQE